MSCLSAVDLCRVGQACKQLQEVAFDDHLWKSLYQVSATLLWLCSCSLPYHFKHCIQHAKENHYLEKNPSKKLKGRKIAAREQMGSNSWMNKYKETFCMRPKKGIKIINNPNSISLQLASNHVSIGDGPNDQHYIEGEVSAFLLCVFALLLVSDDKIAGASVCTFRILDHSWCILAILWRREMACP